MISIISFTYFFSLFDFYEILFIFFLKLNEKKNSKRRQRRRKRWSYSKKINLIWSYYFEKKILLKKNVFFQFLFLINIKKKVLKVIKQVFMIKYFLLILLTQIKKKKWLRSSKCYDDQTNILFGGRELMFNLLLISN